MTSIASPRSSFATFCGVGLIGFAVNWLGVTVGLHSGLQPDWSYALGWHAAMTTTWLLNRRLTFAVIADPSFAEWVRWWISQAAGGAAGSVVFHCASAALLDPAGSLVLSTLAGTVINFSLGRIAVGYKLAQRNT